MPLIDLRHNTTAAVSALFERIRSAPADIWITLRDEADVAAEVGEVRRRIDAGEDLPLAGYVFAAKDNIDVAGLPTTAAHPAFAHTPERTATVVERIVAAGAILIGKTNMDQFATGLVGSRSPYGAVSSAHHPDRVAGGSSSGSGAAAGWGIVDFSLGTDTAGSGRVPAAYNRVVGLKPTLGLLPLDGVLPASPSYDAVSVFAPGIALATKVLDVAAGSSTRDPRSRACPADAPQAAPARPAIAVPDDESLKTLSPGMRAAFDRAVRRAVEIGAEVSAIDLEPFLEAARLLYDGGLVSERAWSFGSFLAEHPEHADPSVATIAAGAMSVEAVSVIDAQQRLVALTAEAKRRLDGSDALMLPTAPLHPSHAELAADPIGVNRTVGTFTNFVNLMDMAAIAVPGETVAGEGEFGVSFVVPAFHDQVAVDIAARFTAQEPGEPLRFSKGIDVAVFGAHLRGEPLNRQLQDLGARYVRDVSTAGTFRMLLVEGPVDRPAVIRATTGAELPGELWRLSPLAVSQLLTSIAAPLALGRIELADGDVVLGFTASVADGHRDITDLGGWRAFRAVATV
ncbi:allophanate hydrolase [Microbacterium betulae]|uniref:Allophanate hydrolase n=1 Tax=Microbacterium betulae TaxID=2981139 RepID=A0AA97FHQ1_9MICO|nr:allophanate hydrolase [Microbacterium sp. AB]WOF23230.1 allophanate hydrolase [Microbacterium sp. AB]